MPRKKTTVTKYHHEITQKFKVGMVVEFYREMEVVAVDAEEAGELAEARIRAKHKVLSDIGYVIGDVEIVSAEKKNESTK